MHPIITDDTAELQIPEKGVATSFTINDNEVMKFVEIEDTRGHTFNKNHQFD